MEQDRARPAQLGDLRTPTSARLGPAFRGSPGLRATDGLLVVDGVVAGGLARGAAAQRRSTAPPTAASDARQRWTCSVAPRRRRRARGLSRRARRSSSAPGSGREEDLRASASASRSGSQASFSAARGGDRRRRRGGGACSAWLNAPQSRARHHRRSRTSPFARWARSVPAPATSHRRPRWRTPGDRGGNRRSCTAARDVLRAARRTPPPPRRRRSPGDASTPPSRTPSATKSFRAARGRDAPGDAGAGDDASDRVRALRSAAHRRARARSGIGLDMVSRERRVRRDSRRPSTTAKLAVVVGVLEARVRSSRTKVKVTHAQCAAPALMLARSFAATTGGGGTRRRLATPLALRAGRLRAASSGRASGRGARRRVRDEFARGVVPRAQARYACDAHSSRRKLDLVRGTRSRASVRERSAAAREAPARAQRVRRSI